MDDARKARRKLKQDARLAVRTAIRRGLLVRPSECSGCHRLRAIAGQIQQHHYMGYEPKYHLVVRWLCRACRGATPRECDVPMPQRRRNALSSGRARMRMKKARRTLTTAPQQETSHERE